MPTFQDYLREIGNISDYDPKDFTEEQSRAWYEIMDELQTGLSDKVDSFALWLRLQTVKAKGLREEAAEILKRAKAIENKVESLKTHYMSVMVQNNMTKVDGTKHTISIRNTKGVRIDEDVIESLPHQFKKITIEPMKTEIRKAIEAGEQIPGCEIVERQSLNVR